MGSFLIILVCPRLFLLSLCTSPDFICSVVLQSQYLDDSRMFAASSALSLQHQTSWHHPPSSMPVTLSWVPCDSDSVTHHVAQPSGSPVSPHSLSHDRNREPQRTFKYLHKVGF